MGWQLRRAHRGWAAGHHRHRHRAAAGRPILRGHPAAAPGRAGRSRTDDQPLVRPLRQDGRVMTITLSREQPNLRNASVPVRQRRSAGSPAEGSESGVRATADGLTTPAPRDPADPSDLTDDPAGPPALTDQDIEESQVIEGKHPVVAVTGAARGVGRALIARLAESDRVRKVVAIDDHRGDVRGVTWRVADVRDPALAGRLAGVDVVVHPDFDLAPDSDARSRRAYNVRGAQTVLTAAAAGRVGRVVLVTSAMVYGARPDNPVPLPEDAPLTADTDSSVAGDLLEIEQLARRSPRANPGMTVTVVRPAALVGEGVDTLITRHFEAPRLLAVKGCAPRWQFCHVDDLVSALELAAAAEVTGKFAVGCDG